MITIPPFRPAHIVRRTGDATGLNVIANDPAVRPLIGGDGLIDMTAIIADTANIALVSDDGGFVAVHHGACRYEVHSMFAPTRTRQSSIHAMRDGLAYMFTSTPCVELITKVPLDNVAAKGLTQLAGFRHQFESLSTWSPTSKKQIGFYSLELDKWAVSSKDTRRMGEWFHTVLDDILTDHQHAAHPDDPVHDSMVGATIGMLQSGLLWKAIAFYNRWALWTGYEEVTIESECPIVVAFDHLRIEIMHSNIEVLSCQ